MSKVKKRRSIIIFLCIVLVLFVGSIIFSNPDTQKEDIKTLMRDAVLHESGKISFLGLVDVNPAFISAVTVSVILLIFAAIVRIFVIPRFTMIPGRFQLLLESWVGFFDNLAKTNSPHRNTFLGAYIFAAGSYIFISTIFELFGLQGVSTAGTSITLPAPLADINAAISLGLVSYLVILFGGLIGNGLMGMGSALKDFSLPISMSFRLFGALLSGLLVTELVYYYIQLSFVVPVAVGVLFTLLHALIQTYVLTMLVSVFYGESSAPSKKKDMEN